MRRRIFTIFSALSLALLIVAIGMLVRSYQIDDRVFLTSPQRSATILSFRGEVECIWHRPAYNQSPAWYADDPRTPTLATLDLPLGRKWYWAGFAYDPPSPHSPWGSKTWTFTSVAFPLWSVIALASTLPIAWCVQRGRGRRRVGTGLCLACGYDLRASFDKCPECGLAIPADLVRKPLT